MKHQKANQGAIAVLGAGSWGTAIAIHLSRAGHRVLLWSHSPEHVNTMKQDRANARYLPNIPFPETLIPTADCIQSIISNAAEVIIAVPSHAFTTLLSTLPKPAHGIAWLTKGLDPKHHQFLSQSILDRWGATYPFVVISGPSFAREVADGLPTALVIASHSTAYSNTIQGLLHHNHVRVYQTDDTLGVQLCGAVKNVLAIACGISDGLNYGANARAALITRGLSEMCRLGTASGALAETFMGLAGVGDLVLTCTDNQSRNRRFGLLLGEGKSVKAAERSIGQVVEGKYNAAQVCGLAKHHHIEMPICEAVNAMLQGNLTAKSAAEALMSRPPKHE